MVGVDERRKTIGLVAIATIKAQPKIKIMLSQKPCQGWKM
jgi:hypothetical protein